MSNNFIQHYCGCGGWYKFYPNNYRYTRDDKRYHDMSYKHVEWIQSKQNEEQKFDYSELWKEYYENACIDIANLKYHYNKILIEKYNLKHQLDSIILSGKYKTLENLPKHFLDELFDLYNNIPPECCICMEKMTKQTFNLTRNCFHKICNNCIPLCENKCPVCRISF